MCSNERTGCIDASVGSSQIGLSWGKRLLLGRYAENVLLRLEVWPLLGVIFEECGRG